MSACPCTCVSCAQSSVVFFHVRAVWAVLHGARKLPVSERPSYLVCLCRAHKSEPAGLRNALFRNFDILTVAKIDRFFSFPQVRGPAGQVLPPPCQPHSLLFLVSALRSDFLSCGHTHQRAEGRGRRKHPVSLLMLTAVVRRIDCIFSRQLLLSGLRACYVSSPSSVVFS